MVTYMAQAIRWAVGRTLGRQESKPVPHSQLEHVHWDRVGHRWLAHHDHIDDTLGRAA